MLQDLRMFSIVRQLGDCRAKAPLISVQQKTWILFNVKLYTMLEDGFTSIFWDHRQLQS